MVRDEYPDIEEHCDDDTDGEGDGEHSDVWKTEFF